MQRLEVTTDRIDVNHVLKSVLQTDQEKIAYTIEQIDEETFDNAIDKIIQADTIYILGVRSCAGLASFLGFYFNIIFPRVKVVNTNSISEIFEIIHHISDKDVVIGISFPRYSKRIIKALEYARTRQAHVIAITDSYISPIAQYAEHTLIGRSEMVSFVDSLVAPLSIINAIIVAISLRKKDEISANLDNLETVWMEYEVYDDTRELNGQNPNNSGNAKEKCD
ncbi:MAG: MurR/RpiR family transcriptional regulator, partial [Niameybacter sp.]